MKILSVGWFRSTSSTSLHRHHALEKNADSIDKIEAGPETTSLKFRIAYHLFQQGIPIKLPDETKANIKIIALVTKNEYDVVWIDKGITINKATLLYVKQKLPLAKIVSFSPDNMALRHNQSQNYLECIPHYDFTFSTKSYILEDLRKLGANNVNFINKTYGEDFHYPRDLTLDDTMRLGADVGFIGAWEKERCDSVLFLAKNGIKVKVFGDGKWNAFKDESPNLTILPGIFSEDYPKALQAFKISLCFLRKKNFDQQTARTMEIPACGGFMMAERTQEHLELFAEGKEAAFFSTNEELLELCRYYLAHEEERITVTEAGLERCITSGYSNQKTMKNILDLIFENG